MDINEYLARLDSGRIYRSRIADTYVYAWGFPGSA